MREYAVNQDMFLPFRQNGIQEALQNPEIAQNGRLCIIDAEGPLLAGDFALFAVRKLLRPQNPKHPEVDYGGILYQVIYDVYTAYTKKRRTLADQVYEEDSFPYPAEGTSIIYPFVPLLVSSVSQESFLQMARSYAQAVPGAKEFMHGLKDRGFSIITPTTSFKETTEVMLEVLDLPVDQVIGTPLPWRKIEEMHRDDKTYYTDEATTRHFLETWFSEIDAMVEAETPDQEQAAKGRLYHTVADFYFGKLGVSYNQNDQNKSTRAIIIEAHEVITDVKKAEAARALSKGKETVVRIGDGSNDVPQLTNEEYEQEEKHVFTVAVNGHPLAVVASDIGIVTENVQDILPVIDVILERYPTDRAELLVTKMQERVGENTTVHLGGGSNAVVSEELLTLHEQKRYSNKREEHIFRA